MKKFCLALFAASAGMVFAAGPFDNLDRDGDGKLSRAEVPPDRREQFGRIDRSGDGYISREEFDEMRRRQSAQGQTPTAPPNIEVVENIAYAGTDDPKQRLDLYLPKDRKGKRPLLVWIHGGAWKAGDKRQGLGALGTYLRDGNYIGASVEYRFSQDAIWPAQIHDCKAAIRWLRGNADKYGIDPDRIAVAGGSAGGHLVAMLGTSGGVKELEGTLGAYTAVSSRVSCVVDLFGPADFPSITNAPSQLRHGDADSPEALLIGGRIAEKPEAARSVSPVTYASEDDPPFMIVHGTEDRTVPFQQSEAMNAALLKAEVKTKPVFIAMEGGGHGFRSEELNRRIAQFYDLHLRGVKSEISAEPIEVQPAQK